MLIDAILPDSPDVFVVPDGRQDARFLSNPLITGPPYIRFYAGAALLVNDIKVNMAIFLIFIKPCLH
jgi:GAF domain-containing protein